MNHVGWSFPRAELLPVYPFLAADEIKHRVIQSGAEIIDLGLGNPDRPTPPEIVARLHATADEPANHRYHPGRGALELREAFARWYARRYHVRFDPNEETIVTIGAKEGISHFCLTVLDRGDTAIVPDPCYPIHEGGPLIAGASIERYPVTRELSAARAVNDAIDRVRARGGKPKLVVANYPHNPTGTAVSPSELAELVRVVAKSDCMLLHDIAYADLDFGNRFAPSIFACGVDAQEVRRFAVEVFSMSKSYNMPGWRIGLMAGNDRMIRALAHVKSYLDYGTFRPLQLAAAWALDDGDSLVDVIRGRYHERMEALVGGLNECGWGSDDAGIVNVEMPGGTMFLWVPLPAKWRSETSLEVTRRLLENAHVAVSPGHGFGELGEGFVRFSLIADSPVLREACARIGKALGS